MSGNKSDLILRLNNVPVDKRGECPVVDEEEYDSATENIVTTEDRDDAENVTRSNSALLESLEQIQAELVRMQKLYENAALENKALKKKIAEKEMRVPDRELNAPYTLLKEIMVEFDGSSDVSVWVKQFKNVEKSYNADANTMRALLVSKLKGKAQQWLVQLPDYAAKNPDEILEALVDNFKCMASSKLQQRQAFENRKWRTDETFALYCADKTNLAKNLNMLEDELVEYIVDGIPDPRLRDHANISCLTSTTQLLRAFGKVSLKPLIRKPDPKNDDVRCFNCNGKGHWAAECKKPKREKGSCYSCGSKQHFIIDCPEYKKQKPVMLVHAEDEEDFVRIFSICLKYSPKIFLLQNAS